MTEPSALYGPAGVRLAITIPSTGDGFGFVVPEWVPTILRYGVIGLVAPAGVDKFLSYSQSVKFFATLGLPSPEITVLLVGAIELCAVALLLIDTVRLIAAIALLPVMVVALVTAGDWQALAVLMAVIGLLAIELDVLDVPDDAPSS